MEEDASAYSQRMSAELLQFFLVMLGVELMHLNGKTAHKRFNVFGLYESRSIVGRVPVNR